MGENHIVGAAVPRKEGRDKVTGAARYIDDMTLPGMLVAVVARPPVFGGKVKSFNADKAKAVAGVQHVIQIDRGVAVVADGFWPAKLGREALEVSWDDGELATLYENWRARLIEQAAWIEAAIDFSDEDLPADLYARARGALANVRNDIAGHIARLHAKGQHALAGGFRRWRARLLA